MANRCERGVQGKKARESMCVDVEQKNRLLFAVHLSNTFKLMLHAKYRGELSLVKGSAGNGTGEEELSTALPAQ